MTSAEKQERENARAKLREWLKPGDTVWCILRHVSRSGMQRTIEPVIIEDDGRGNGPEPREIGWAVARALGLPFDRDRGGVKVGGAGMDMGAHLVYELSRALWPDGFGCTGENCRSNDHTNGDRDYTPYAGTADCPDCTDYDENCRCRGLGYIHVKRAERWHRDGGYALRQRWI